ncbi:MAG: hypothetical protein LC122_15620 [Chitinophagales bacterium]|nr:hypothetical protein [Chitinophagales bacterium]
MEKVIILPAVRRKLDELIEVLVKEQYFSYLYLAEKYVHNIYDFMNTLPQQKVKPTLIKTYGAYYCQYKPNKHTTWYITFDTNGKTWLIKNIFNNHTKDYPRYIGNLEN